MEGDGYSGTDVEKEGNQRGDRVEIEGGHRLQVVGSVMSSSVLPDETVREREKHDIITESPLTYPA